MGEAMVPRRRQGSGCLSAGVTGVQELVLTGVTERWQMRGQRRAADLVFGGSMNSVESSLSVRCSGTCPLCVFTEERSPDAEEHSNAGEGRGSHLAEDARGVPRSGEITREREATATCSRPYQPLARKQNRSEPLAVSGWSDYRSF